MTGGWVMEVSLKDVVQILGVLISFAVAIWGIVRWVITRMDQQKEKFEATLEHQKSKQEQEIKHLHDRINGVKDEYVKRSDLDREFQGIQNNMVDMKKDFHLAMQALNTRFDQVIALLTKRSD